MIRIYDPNNTPQQLMAPEPTCRLSSGQEVSLGLLCPARRPQTFAPLFDAVDKRKTDELITDSSRTPRREIFGGEKWIRNQGGRGSCNGYAGAKALERACYLHGQEHIPLSGEGLYAQINGGRDGGSMLDDGMKAICENGVPPEAMVEHETYLWRHISSQARQAMSRFRGLECYRASTELELAAGLALGFVGVVAVHVTRNFSRLDSRGVVAPSSGPGNHAVGVDDVRIVNGKYQFDMFNSWGLRYGEQGRGWLTWSDHLASCVRNHYFYLIRAPHSDPMQQSA